MNRFLRATGTGFKVSKKVKFHLQPGVVMSSGSPLINTFVFCASIEDDGSEILDQKFGTHKIEIFDIEKFAYLVLLALNQELHFKKSVKMTGIASGIGCTHNSVTYDNKDDLVVESIDDLPEIPFVDIEEIFIKPKDLGFEEENEYRFTWYPLNTKDETMCGIAYDFDYIDLHIPNICEAIRDAT
ncbi:MAG: hypothetical protein GY828_02350 [Candidatus Gracilibacteria bacterium]|nr:hypothetical protein [Candidatus Gracilibacteria bacterium]